MTATWPGACNWAGCAKTGSGSASPTCWAMTSTGAIRRCTSWRANCAFPWWPAAMCRCIAHRKPCTTCLRRCATIPASRSWDASAWPTASSICERWTNYSSSIPRPAGRNAAHLPALQFSLDELRYEYPEEVVPEGYSAKHYLRGWQAGQRGPLARAFPRRYSSA